MISITDASQNPTPFPDSSLCQDILRLQFDDVVVGPAWSSGRFTPFTKEQARKVIGFVSGIKSKIDLLVVHCQAGVSRSAGVAGAVVELFTEEKPFRFFGGRYCPNMRVYGLIVQEAVELGLVGAERRLDAERQLGAEPGGGGLGAGGE